MTVVDRVAERLAYGVRGWLALGAVVLFAWFTAVVLPAQAEAGAFYTVRYAAPDTSVWYFPDDLYAAAEAWGRDGRAAYVHARVTFDVIWPMVYGTFLLTTLAWSTVFVGIPAIIVGLLLGPYGWAKALRARMAGVAHDRPEFLYGGAVLIVLFLIIWEPVPATRRILTILVFLAVIVGGAYAVSYTHLTLPTKRIV